MIDSHCHLDHHPLYENINDVIYRSKEAGISKDEFLKATYGLKRFKGVINFMMAEDWSERLPQTKEWINLLNKQRGWDDKFLKVFPIFKDIL